MKKKIFQYFISILLLLSISFGSSFAWVGLFANTGDILTNTKWNEMITELNTKLEASNIIAGTGISVTASGSDVTINSLGGGGSAIPYIESVSPSTMQISTTGDIEIEGINFTPTSTFSIPSWPGSINTVTVNSPTSITANVTSGPTDAFFDTVVSNGGASNTIWTGNGVNALEVKTINWNDLRLGGDVFTHGNGAGNDIRYRLGMSMTRDATGMHFSGAAPWSSWVKFESLGWTRGDNKTLEWVFTTPSGSMMVGIGSDATNETNTAQYAQAEVEAYFQNTTTMWGLYGNNGNIGTAGNQASSTTISSCTSGTYKVRFTGDGDAGDTFTLYCLPSAAPADWDNIATVITTLTIGGSLNPDETNIMPFIIPRAGTQRFIAVKVD